MKRLCSTPMLVISAIIVWLAACGLLTWVHFAYDGGIHTSYTYCWIYGGVALLIGLLTDTYDEQEPKQPSRWTYLICLLLFGGIVFGVVWQIDQYGFSYLFYNPNFWWLAFLLAVLLVAILHENSRFRRPHKPHQKRSSPFRASVAVLVCYLPLLPVTLLYLAIVHPVTVDEITPIGEAEGGQFIGRIDGDRAETPLGLYFFADGEHWYYYDVLTGAPADYDDPYHPD